MAQHDRTSEWLPGVLAGISTGASAVGLFYLAVFFKDQLGFSGVEIGALFALQAGTGVVASLVAGLLCDLLTSRSLAVLGFLLQALGFLGLSLFEGFAPVALSFFVFSFASWTVKLSLDVQVLKTDRGDRTGQRIGSYQALRFLGLTLGTIATGFLVTRFDFRASLALAAGISLLLAPLALALAPTTVARVRARDYLADLRLPRVRWFALWMFLFTLHWGAENTSYGLFLREELHLSYQGMGLYMAVEFLAVLLATWRLGFRTHNADQVKRLALWGLLLSGLGHVGMIWPPVAMSVFFRALHGFGDGAMVIVMYFGIARLFSVARLGGNTGFINMVTMLGFVVGSLGYGWLGEAHGYATPLWTSGIITALLALPLLWLPRLSQDAAPPL